MGMRYIQIMANPNTTAAENITKGMSIIVVGTHVVRVDVVCRRRDHRGRIVMYTTDRNDLTGTIILEPAQRVTVVG